MRTLLLLLAALSSSTLGQFSDFSSAQRNFPANGGEDLSPFPFEDVAPDPSFPGRARVDRQIPSPSIYYPATTGMTEMTPFRNYDEKDHRTPSTGGFRSGNFRDAYEKRIMNFRETPPDSERTFSDDGDKSLGRVSLSAVSAASAPGLDRGSSFDEKNFKIMFLKDYYEDIKNPVIPTVSRPIISAGFDLEKFKKNFRENYNDRMVSEKSSAGDYLVVPVAPASPAIVGFDTETFLEEDDKQMNIEETTPERFDLNSFRRIISDHKRFGRPSSTVVSSTLNDSKRFKEIFPKEDNRRMDYGSFSTAVVSASSSPSTSGFDFGRFKDFQKRLNYIKGISAHRIPEASDIVPETDDETTDCETSTTDEIGTGATTPISETTITTMEYETTTDETTTPFSTTETTTEDLSTTETTPVTTIETTTFITTTETTPISTTESTTETMPLATFTDTTVTETSTTDSPWEESTTTDMPSATSDIGWEAPAEEDEEEFNYEDACGTDLMWHECVPNCRHTCFNMYSRMPCPTGCTPGCFCPPGHVVGLQGKCVLPQDCFKSPCQPNEVWTDCVNKCAKCECGGPPCAMGQCEEGCDCVGGLVRNAADLCVHETQCSCESPGTGTSCPPNEVWTDCVNKCAKCDCGVLPCAEGQCEEGCACVGGFFRNAAGRCVPETQCSCKSPVEGSSAQAVAVAAASSTSGR